MLYCTKKTNVKKLGVRGAGLCHSRYHHEKLGLPYLNTEVEGFPA